MSTDKVSRVRRAWFVPFALCVAAVATGIIAAAAILFSSGCRDPFSTKLKQQSDRLHSGLSFQEVTNHLTGFEMLSYTNYPTPEQRSWLPQSQRDYVQQVFSTNLTASRILFRTPRGGSGWSDACSVDFDADGLIIGYTWMYPH